MKRAKTSPEFRSHLAIFNKNKSTHDEISEAGGKLLRMMYGLKDLKSLNRARYFRFKKLVAEKNNSTNTDIAFCILPPTIGSAIMYSHGMEMTSIPWSMDGKIKQLICPQFGGGGA